MSLIIYGKKITQVLIGDIADDENDEDDDEESDGIYQINKNGDSTADELIDDADYVKIVNRDYEAWFATVLGESYGDDIEIQYIEKKDRTKDSQEPGELQKLEINNVHVDGRSHVYFK